MSLLEALIIVSEKAANIARICREDEHLLQLLVQLKDADSTRNPRFIQDFKTLADVLIQETVKKDIISKYPELKGKIQGEESNTFENTTGKSITVLVKEDPLQTADLLEVVLNGYRHVADLLANEIHRDIPLETIRTNDYSETNIEIDLNDLGIWIDPIDSTAEYINAVETKHNNGIYLTGLRCVTILIGVYSLSTNKSIIGVVNQPFNTYENNAWYGHCYWGISTTNSNACSLAGATVPFILPKIVCISSNEDLLLRNKLSAAGYQLIEVAGAGYKTLTVIMGLCDAYILSKGSTYMWDTCGPHAVLKAQGGNIFKFQSKQKREELLYYNEESDKIANCANKYGLIACRNEETFGKIIMDIGYTSPI